MKKIRQDKTPKLTYYRDELNEYSPLIDAKILGKDIFNQDVIVSMLLYLNEKESNNDFSKLKPHEKEFFDKKTFIFQDLKNHQETNYLKTTLKRHIEDLIEDDMKDLSLIEYKYKENIGHLRNTDLLTFLLFIANIFCLSSIFKNYHTDDILKFIFVFEIFVNLLWITIYIINISLNLTFKMNLTEKGRIYLGKLNASKNFLKDYSLISKRNIREENLWGSYIRNAIFFNLKGKLDDEAKKYYKQIIDKYKYKEIYKLKLSKLLNSIIYIIALGPWFLILLVGNKNIDKLVANLILSNFIINPFIFGYFIKKNNPTAIKKRY